MYMRPLTATMTLALQRGTVIYLPLSQYHDPDITMGNCNLPLTPTMTLTLQRETATYHDLDITEKNINPPLIPTMTLTLQRETATFLLPYSSLDITMGKLQPSFDPYHDLLLQYNEKLQPFFVRYHDLDITEGKTTAFL